MHYLPRPQEPVHYRSITHVFDVYLYDSSLNYATYNTPKARVTRQTVSEAAM